MKKLIISFCTFLSLACAVTAFSSCTQIAEEITLEDGINGKGDPHPDKEKSKDRPV